MFPLLLGIKRPAETVLYGPCCEYFCLCILFFCWLLIYDLLIYIDTNIIPSYIENPRTRQFLNGNWKLSDKYDNFN